MTADTNLKESDTNRNSQTLPNANEFMNAAVGPFYLHNYKVTSHFATITNDDRRSHQLQSLKRNKGAGAHSELVNCTRDVQCTCILISWNIKRA